MNQDKVKRIAVPSTKDLRIEAPGCVIYIDHVGRGGGTLVEVVPDGARFAGKGCMLGRTSILQAGKRVDGEPTALGLRILVDREQMPQPDSL
jgi:hypothetical protein